MLFTKIDNESLLGYTDNHLITRFTIRQAGKKKMMKYILGLDIGVQSIGWAIIADGTLSKLGVNLKKSILQY